MLVYHLVSIVQDGSRKPEVLITSLLQKIKASFQSQNGATKLTECRRHRLTAGDTTECWICKMEGNTKSGDNLGICPNIVIVLNPKHAYA